MLRLQPFELVQPESIGKVLQLLSTHAEHVRIISGGTDLVPNLKLGSIKGEVLVSLQRIDELKTLKEADTQLVIGAGVSLHTIATSKLVQGTVPVLADAVGKIASPQIRNMGTLGGNLCLDTRCRYINQSEFIRSSFGGCLKSDGDRCHVVPGGSLCVAALSSDSVPVLIALGADVDIIGPEGERTIPVEELYTKDGVAHIALSSDEVVVRARVPIPAAQTRISYRKWAVRKSIDFPLVSVAVRIDHIKGSPDILEDGRVVVGVLGPQPKILRLSSLQGQPINEEMAHKVAGIVSRRCTPLANVPYSEDYRKLRLAVEVKRAIRSLFI